MSEEFFYLDEHGNKCDAALHEEMLNNQEADDAASQDAVYDAIHVLGMDLQEALQLYGTENIRRRYGWHPNSEGPRVDPY